MPINADGKVMNLDNQTRQTIIQASENLFSQHGWQRISIGDICAEAKISRVSFYRYFKNKIELLKEIIALQQVKVKTRYTKILRDTTNIEELINAIFNYQEEALKQFFTAPVLKDFDNNKNQELNDFFDKERQKKYIFMNHFFEELQRKKIIDANYPVPLIHNYLRIMDELMFSEHVQAMYCGEKKELRKDILKLIMFGLSGPNLHQAQ